MMPRRSIALLVVACLLAACDSAPIATPPTPVAQRGPRAYPPMEYPTEAPAPNLPAALRQRTPLAAPPTSPSGPTPTSGRAVEGVVEGQVQQQLLQIELDTAKVRGLDPKSDVAEHFINKKQMRDELVSKIDEGYSREEARLDELALWLLRFVDEPQIDLYQMQLDLLSEQVIGLYDPDRKELFVLGGQARLDPQARETLSHEFVHSLQDQYFDLHKVLPRGSKDGERIMAARSVVEGDATFSSLLWADQYMSREDFGKLIASQGPSRVLNSVPDIFQEQLLFPYTKGVEFVKTVYTRVGFKAVNAAFTDPPHSTEQIMHPEKYLATPRDEPVPVGLPPLTGTLSAGWAYQATGTIGEFELGVLLRGKSVAQADRAAAGWGGGQYDLYANGTDSLLFMGTIWDTLEDAKQFETGLRDSLVRTPKFGSLWVDGSRYFVMQRVKNRVFFVGGTDRTTVQGALQAVK